VVVTFPDGSTFEYGDLLMTGGLEPAGDTMLVPIDVHACTYLYHLIIFYEA
jgi:hypothetical protein